MTRLQATSGSTACLFGISQILDFRTYSWNHCCLSPLTLGASIPNFDFSRPLQKKACGLQVLCKVGGYPNRGLGLFFL